MTPLQAKLYDFIALTLRYKPVAPTRREMATHMGYKSIGSNIHDLLIRLERDGHIIIHRNRARSIELVNKSEFDRGFAAGRLSILSEIEAKHCSPVVHCGGLHHG